MSSIPRLFSECLGIKQCVGVDELSHRHMVWMVWAVANSGIISWTIIITLALAAMWMATTINTNYGRRATVSILQRFCQLIRR